MKAIYLCILCALVVSCSLKEQSLKEGMYRINGKVTNLENGILYLISYYDGARSIDTIKISGNKFSIEGTMEGLVKGVTIANNTDPSSKEPNARLFLEPTIMKLQLDGSNLASFKMTGSNTQVDADALQKQRNALADKYKAELDAFEANRKLYDEATTEEDKKKYKWKDDDLRTELEPYFEEGVAVTKQFVLDHPTSFVSLQNLAVILKHLTQEEAKAIFDKIPPEFKEEPIAVRIRKDIEDMNKGIPGAMAGDFNTVDIKGNPIALADFKGQYLLIDFWASWCVPCRKGNPHLLELYAKYKSKGLEILGVSDDDRNPDAWHKAVKEDKIGVWRHVLRGLEVDRSKGGYKIVNDGISGGYNISTLPTKILVGPDGIIIGRYGGGGEDDAAMDKKLAELFGA
ncbi:AhpC/TSA family protein [Flavobacteriaceae bacterium F08102]|nr:AhpC/TSA family protein [Flavobacteriaceae bacterium F08102]